MARRRKEKKPQGAAARTLAEARDAGRSLQAWPCGVQDACGGCSFQELTYAEELDFKRRLVVEAFRAQGFEGLLVPRPVAAPRIYGYRNHMEFSFSSRRWLTRAEIESGTEFARDFALGLHAPGGFGRVIDLERCDLQAPAMNRLFQALRELIRASGRPAYDHREHQGFWRFLVIRRSEARGDILLHLVTRERDRDQEAELLRGLADRGLLPATVTWGVSDSVADTSAGAEIEVIHGPGHIVEAPRGLAFRIGPRSFFQPNSLTAGIIFDLVAEMAGELDGRSVLDLFCGAGTIGLHLAARGARVLGLELVEEAVEHARRNARDNDLEGRAEFLVADLLKGLPEGIERPDLLVSDPPRAGMHPRAVDRILELAPRRIVSVGCNPKTQAVDLRRLVDEGGYRISRMQAVDQFPRTPHVENLALLER
ncbi:MAG: 23S rRNA (uracil(1939)-C(5))-methyltransferase RlmD [Planctomycetes bacterium]|nr:23S rRNA (uracil(1939)-C(5))-methyltransferase RlmD [Planctomycetota bacterium]